MEAVADPRHGIGGNQPPEPLDPHAAITARVQERIDAANIWLGQVAEIADLTTAQACDDFIGQLRREWSRTDEERKTEKKPHDLAAAAVQSFFNPLLAKLELAESKLRPLKQGWLNRVEAEQKAEAERKQREADALAAKAREAEEAVRAGTGDVIGNIVESSQLILQADTAQREADKAAAAKPQVQGEFSSRASGFRTVWSATITDKLKALRYYRDDPRLVALLQQLADADARRFKDTGRTVPGVSFKSTRTV